ncbi:MAG: BMC domain-containing protein [Verrucomicrobia bacterium]|nr:BMC domain-containing protein [Verrucomicrobiota bacterium]MBQ7590786.1 BMC domain-containing protein [Verrucomicrobiota bacterium]
MVQAIGMLETRGLVALVQGTDAMLKAANVQLAGPMKQVGNAMVTAVVVGDVAAVQAAVDAGVAAIKTTGGQVVSAHVIARPNDDVKLVLPQAPKAATTPAAR